MPIDIISMISRPQFAVFNLSLMICAHETMLISKI